MERLLLKPMEAAQLLNVGRSRIYAMLADGTLPHVRLGERSIRIPMASLKQWLESLDVQASGAENSGEVATSGAGRR